MHDDDLMDRLLREAMAATVPRLPSGFDAEVMRRVRPQRLTPNGRLVIALYVLLAVAAAAWAMQDLPLTAIIAAVTICALVAAVTSAYGRHLAASH